MKTFYKIRLLLLYTFVFCVQGDSLFSIECSHTFDLNLNLAQILDLNLGTKIRVINSYTSEIFVKSPCCQNITIDSTVINCSFCSQNGIKVCNISDELIQIKGIQNTECESRSDISLSCKSRVCLPRNNTDDVEVYRPGDETGCLMDNRTYTCSRFGNWTDASCSDGEEVPTSTIKSTSTQMTTSTVETTISIYATTNNISDISNTSSELYNTTDHNILYNIETLMYGPDLSNETASEIFEPEKAMKALYTFLIVLGVVLLLVSILVGGFFIRKKKDKVSISHVDYPLEYWHDREYIDNIVEKRFTPNSVFTVNPVFDNKNHGQTRYKKKDESEYKKRRNNAIKDHKGDGTETPKRSNAYRTESNGSVSSNTDRPRKTRNDYTDKYLATATGSNFYNYSPSQTQDVVKKTTDLDVSTEDECDRAAEQGTSSFTSTKKKDKQRSGRRDERDDENNRWNEHCPDVIEDNMYSMSYKEHLRRSLDYWSAEESDA